MSNSKVRASGIAVIALSLAACAFEYAEETAEVRQTINNGTPTSARPEVQQWQTGIGSCTATLITPTMGLSAGHCTLGYPVPIRGGTFQGRNVTDVFVFGAGPEVDDLTTPLNMDVAVFRLDGAVTGQAGIPIGNALPSLGTHTQIGFGCDSDGSGGHTKQYRTFSYPLAVTCSGDSGGPLFPGALGANGPIVAVASCGGAECYGNALMFREDIAGVMRYYAEAYGDGDFEPGVNRVGWDLSGMPVTHTTRHACRTACVNDSQCKAFTWNSSNNACWLKGAVARWEGASTNYWSGVISRSTSVVAEVNTDRMGGEFVPAFSATASACRLACERDSRCKAYTHYSGNCYLKSFAPNPSALTGATSAVRKAPTLYARRPGTIIETVEVDYPQPEECSARCAWNASCTAWNYRRPMVGLKAQCELMSNTVAPVDDQLSSTGVQGRAFY